LVDQPEYGTNTSYLFDFLELTLSAKLLNVEQIGHLYIQKGYSAAQIAKQFGVAKSSILARLHGLGIRQEAVGRSTNPENYRCRMAPYGYAVRGGKLVPNKLELRTCRLVVDLVLRQGMSFNKAATVLVQKGIKNKSGRVTWDHSTVRAIFNRWKDKL
jgi:transposase